MKRKVKKDPGKARVEQAHDPNWVEGRFVVLIHKGTGECLGEFKELKHKVYPASRRLVRTDAGLAGLLSDHPVEFVDGEHWLRPTPTVSPKVNYTDEELRRMRDRLAQLLDTI
jgi:hypothetical protein